MGKILSLHIASIVLSKDESEEFISKLIGLLDDMRNIVLNVGCNFSTYETDKVVSIGIKYDEEVPYIVVVKAVGRIYAEVVKHITGECEGRYVEFLKPLEMILKKITTKDSNSRYIAFGYETDQYITQ